MKNYFLLIVLFVSINLNAQNVRILRGPYLNKATQSSITLRLKTNLPELVSISYGESPSQKNKLVSTISDNLNYVFDIKELKPNTKYFYEVRSNSQVLLKGDSLYFKTQPLPDSKQKMRFIAYGDCGTLTPEQRKVALSTKRFIKETALDGMLLLGDNAYCCGTDAQYQGGFFDIYKDYFLYNTVVWPTPGNHDYADRSDWGLYNKPDYFSIFSIPFQGESGGLASNNPAYYSYDYGNTHFISLDSFGSENGNRIWDTLSTQIQWLKKDLASTNKTWKIVYFHHPPYTKGSHDSDKEQDLVLIRTNLVKILDDYKVDLVLTGHSHSYERSNLLKRFYGTSPEFDITKNALSSSNGKYDGSLNSCAYTKSEEGLIAIVAGSAGWVGAKSEGFPHKAMAFSNTSEPGALILDIEDNRLDAKWIDLNGNIGDKFSIFKNLKTNTSYQVDCGESVSLMASWIGDYEWSSNSIKTQTVKSDPLILDTGFKVSDSYKCLTENFSVKVNPYPSLKIKAIPPVLEGENIVLSAEFEGKGEVVWSGPAGFNEKGKDIEIKAIKLSNAGIYKAKANYNGCVSESEIQVTVNPILAYLSEESPFLKVYPNPNHGEFEINLALKLQTDVKIEIFDLDGKNVYSKILKKQNPGILDYKIKYLCLNPIQVLKVSTENEIFYKKIIQKP